MAFEADFATFLAGSSRIQTQLGTSAPGSRIQMSVLPQNVTYPAIRYQRISTVRPKTHSGPDGKPTVRMQVDSYAEGAGAAVNLAEAVRKTCEGFKGQMDTVGVDYSFTDDEDAIYEEDADVYRVRTDYMITHREATS